MFPYLLIVIQLLSGYGSSTVMIGGLFSKTFESAAQKINVGGKQFCVYRGQASNEFQKDFYDVII